MMHVRNLRVRHIQCDEIWQFVAKAKNVSPEKKAAGWVDVWTWTAIDADTKIDYAMLVKIYGASNDNPESRYSPATCIGCRTGVLSGDPDPNHISTSFVERQNLSMRMGMRRFTRLTNGFSKKLENHGHMVALYFMHYNFCRVHQTLRVTPRWNQGSQITFGPLRSWLGY
jgi:hypothetical protein